MSITFGAAGAPSQVTINLDSLFSQSLAAYRKQLIDNIAASNAFLMEMLKGDNYRSQDGGTDVRVPAMYALQSADTYDGYDELPTIPVDGVTQAVYEWRQCAAAIVYSMKEVKQNKQKIVDLVRTRIKQAELGLQEHFAQQLMWGSATQGGTLITPYVSPVNGSSGVDPIWKFLQTDPTASNTVGNIAQNTATWWRNKHKASVATTYDGFLLEVDNIFNSCSLGTGGRPKIILNDQTTFELFKHALYQKFRYTNVKEDEAYPFENVMYRGAHFVMDDKTPDTKNSIVPTVTAGAGDPSTLTNGTMGFINPDNDFFELVYESDSDFQMLKDDAGKTMFKPVNGDSRLGHFAWMGTLTCSCRRKQGLMDGIARTLVTP